MKEEKIIRILRKYNEDLFNITKGKPLQEKDYKTLWESAQKSLFAISSHVKFRW